MASRYYTLTLLTPAGTAVATPLSTTWQLEDQTLASVEVDIPDGHNGLTGIRVIRSQQQVVPWGNNSFLVANNRLVTVPVNQELTEAKLVILTYNTGFYDHSFYLRATITDLASSTPGTAGASLSLGQLNLTGGGVVSPPATGG